MLLSCFLLLKLITYSSTWFPKLFFLIFYSYFPLNTDDFWINLVPTTFFDVSTFNSMGMIHQTCRTWHRTARAMEREGNRSRKHQGKIPSPRGCAVTSLLWLDPSPIWQNLYVIILRMHRGATPLIRPGFLRSNQSPDSGKEAFNTWRGRDILYSYFIRYPTTVLREKFATINACNNKGGFQIKPKVMH